MSEWTGKFVRWIRRRESKRQRPRLSVVGDGGPTAATSAPARSGTRLITIDLTKLPPGKQDSTALGLQLEEGAGHGAVVRAVFQDGPLRGSDKVAVGWCENFLMWDEWQFIVGSISVALRCLDFIQLLTYSGTSSSCGW